MNPQMKKERSLSAPEALFYPSIADQVLAFKQVADARMLAKEQGQQGNLCKTYANFLLKVFYTQRHFFPSLHRDVHDIPLARTAQQRRGSFEGQGGHQGNE